MEWECNAKGKTINTPVRYWRREDRNRREWREMRSSESGNLGRMNYERQWMGDRVDHLGLTLTLLTVSCPKTSCVAALPQKAGVFEGVIRRTRIWMWNGAALLISDSIHSSRHPVNWDGIHKSKILLLSLIILILLIKKFIFFASVNKDILKENLIRMIFAEFPIIFK